MSRLILLVTGLGLTLMCASVSVAQQYEKDVETIHATIRDLANKSSGRAVASELKDGNNVVKTDKDPGPGPYSIWLLKIGKGTKANVLVTGTQHAREWVAYRVVLDAGAFLISDYGKEDGQGKQKWPAGDGFEKLAEFKEFTVKKLVDNSTIYMVPVVNPSGYQYSRDKNKTELSP